MRCVTVARFLVASRGSPGPGRKSMWDRIGSLFVAFAGIVLLYVVMRPGTESFLGRILWRFRAFVTSLLQALSFSAILFGVLGFFADSGVRSILHHPMSFLVLSGIGTALFLSTNIAPRESESTL